MGQNTRKEEPCNHTYISSFFHEEGHYRIQTNQSINFLCIDRFRYDSDIHHERVKEDLANEENENEGVDILCKTM